MFRHERVSRTVLVSVMKSPLKTLLLFSVLHGLSCGVPTGGKFSVELKPGPDLSNATVQMHHMMLANGGVVGIRAKAAPSNITFTIIIQVTQYHCTNVDENDIQSEHLGCFFRYERTLAMNDNIEIVWGNSNAEMAYCGKDGIYLILANEDDDFNFLYLNSTSVYLVSISLYADHSQKGIKEFSLSYTLEMKNWYGCSIPYAYFIPYAYGTYHTHIRIWYSHTRMVWIIVPYAYGKII